MAPTDQQLLDKAKQALADILDGRAEEFRDGSESARTLRIQELQRLIQHYEDRVSSSSGSIFKPLREGRV